MATIFKNFNDFGGHIGRKNFAGAEKINEKARKSQIKNVSQEIFSIYSAFQPGKKKKTRDHGDNMTMWHKFAACLPRGAVLKASEGGYSLKGKNSVAVP